MDLSINQNIFPIRSSAEMEDYEAFKLQQKVLWVTEELRFSGDTESYRSLSQKERKLIDMILGFFAVGDAIVIENLDKRFTFDVDTITGKMFLSVQKYIEFIHAETYGKWIEVLIPQERRDEIFRMAASHNSVNLKAEWANKWIVSDHERSVRFFAFACVEGIFFSTLFAIIFWFSSRGKMTEFAASNKFISRDEAIHRDQGCRWFMRYRNSNVPDHIIYEIVKDAIFIEDKFIDEILIEDISDMTKDNLKMYSRLTADNLLRQCNIEPLYMASNPFPFMDMVSIKSKGNFHEIVITDYSGVKNGETSEGFANPSETNF